MEVQLSIIVACFNDGQFLKEAIASAEQYPDPIYEIIIVNDGSSDPLTCQVIARLKERGYHVIDQPNQGLAAARNAGIKVARGKYILPLDADNRLRSNYIRKGIEVLDNHPEVAVVYGDVERFGEGIKDLESIPNFNLEYEDINFTGYYSGLKKVEDFPGKVWG